MALSHARTEYTAAQTTESQNMEQKISMLGTAQ